MKTLRNIMYLHLNLKNLIVTLYYHIINLNIRPQRYDLFIKHE